MKKISVLVACLALVFGPILVDAFQNEPDGFRGVHWGTSLSNLKGYRLLYPYLLDRRVRYYDKEKENLQVFGMTADNIEYGFARGRFYSFRVQFSGEGKIENVKNYLVNKYGPWQSSKKHEAVESDTKKLIKSENFYWPGGVSYINFSCDYTNQKASVNVYSEQVYAEELN
jgi:hypothetical protein